VPSEAAAHADFTAIRYAQCWEDADILLPALDVGAGDTVVSIASAGDNTLALLAQGPQRVVALDLSPAQLACLALRVAAYAMLGHDELLELMGSRESSRRAELYARVRPEMDPAARALWDASPRAVARGVGGAGKFERYFRVFRRRVLPTIHTRKQVTRLLEGGGTPESREVFYREEWDTRRWRMMFSLFFSRTVMGRMGRDPSFFRYVEGSVADRILERSHYAVTQLDPAENPYLQWILTGTHTTALPWALRPENFEAIRENLHRLEWQCRSIEDFLAEEEPGTIGAYNLSDIFEYMSEANAEALMAKCAEAGRPGARLAYWNMLAPRSRPESLAEVLDPRTGLAAELFARDKAFFYSAFRVEEVTR
jgi:S-adenosylmethionine-diacylglycerol 3-amino-3-carboxypropyl transferase